MAVEIVIPPSLRPALAEIDFEPIDIARSAPADQGEMRRRQRYTIVPQVAAVSWTLPQDEFDTFWDWLEDELVVLSRKFDLPLERQGGPGAGTNPRLEWWTAQFQGVPKHEALNGGRYRIAATLLLIGEPFDVRVPPGILASGGIRFRGRVAFAAAPVRAAGGIAFRGGWVVQSAPVIAQGGIAFRGGWHTGLAPADAYAREDSGRILREDGSRLLRE